MKNNFLLLLLCSAFTLACAKKDRAKYQPDTKPNYRIVLAFDLTTAPDKLAMLDSAKNVTLRKLEDRFFYSNVSINADEQTITCDIIGSDLHDKAPSDSLLKFTAALLANEGRLKFFNTYRIFDEGMLAVIAKVLQKESLLQNMVINQSGNPIGYAGAENILKINAGFQNAITKGQLPADLSCAWSLKPVIITRENRHELYFLKGNAMITSANIIAAEAMPSQDNPKEAVISITFDKSGTQKWAEMTTLAAQNGKREIAISLNGGILSAPSVINPITGGISTISGSWPIPDAVILAQLFRYGQLPVPAKIVSAKKLR